MSKGEYYLHSHATPDNVKVSAKEFGGERFVEELEEVYDRYDAMYEDGKELSRDDVIILLAQRQGKLVFTCVMWASTAQLNNSGGIPFQVTRKRPTVLDNAFSKF